MERIGKFKMNQRDFLEEEIKIKLEDARILWMCGDMETALDTAQRLIKSLEKNSSYAFNALLPALRCLTGQWLASSSTSVSFSEIYEVWFTNAIAECNKILQYNAKRQQSSVSSSSTSIPIKENMEEAMVTVQNLLGECYSSVAQFVDKQHVSVLSRISSPEWKLMVALQQKREMKLLEYNRELALLGEADNNSNNNNNNNIRDKKRALERDIRRLTIE